MLNIYLIMHKSYLIKYTFTGYINIYKLLLISSFRYKKTEINDLI